MKDLSNTTDLEILIATFYDNLQNDVSISHFFDQIDLKEHLPIIVSFWDSVLFGNGNYQGNPIQKHMAINEKNKISEDDFITWLSLWNTTIDKLFKGEKASEAKERAKTIAAIMLFKIKNKSGI